MVFQHYLLWPNQALIPLRALWYTLLTFLIPTCSEQAFDFLEKYLALTEPPLRPTLADCDRGGLTAEAVIDMATYAYNACINTLGEIYDLEPQAKPPCHHHAHLLFPGFDHGGRFPALG
jgi:hypothetical protein